MSTFDNPKEAGEWCDRCWSNVVSEWRKWRDGGLTRHHNWWPEHYEEVCEKQRIEPDPAVLSFSTSYETQRGGSEGAFRVGLEGERVQLAS